MSYRAFIRKTINELPQNLRKPTWIATFASVGVHIILWIVLPILPLESREVEEPDIPRPVGLIELTPEEQSRIPEFSVPRADLPPISPVNPDLYSLNPPGSNPFEPIPRTPTPSYTPPPLSLLPPLLPPPPARVPSAPPAVPRNIPAPSPSPMPTPIPTPSPTNPPLEGDTAVVPELDEIIPEPSPGEASPTPATPPPLAEQEELLAALEYNEEGTSQQAALESYTDWFEDVTALLGEDWDGENAEVMTVNAPYPLVACPRQLQGTAVLGVMVDPEGTTIEEPAPQVLQSSGYGLFNQLALDFMQAYEFEPGDTQRAYQVYVQFEYDPEQCPEAFSQSPDDEQPSPEDTSESSGESPSAPASSSSSESPASPES